MEPVDSFEPLTKACLGATLKIGIGVSLAAHPLPHHCTSGSAYGGPVAAQSRQAPPDYLPTLKLGVSRQTVL